MLRTLGKSKFIFLSFHDSDIVDLHRYAQKDQSKELFRIFTFLHFLIYSSKNPNWLIAVSIRLTYALSGADQWKPKRSRTAEV